ncbi:hypothetical protein FYC62_04065 [Pedobacter aquae]|uniref:Uncharacterized protein n=1 Tax=Pedobacter aquae TaxID=2605747 RepID=A0A5C0VFV9_9SPHI|nr:hypothetical protein [Pedobacter aquae]QEK50939.1 hypothetical protein FYC62_04065 [Pedobacter aquae]
MEKVPFTPAGLQQLLTTLYALSDQELNLVADALHQNFKLWVAEHFDLDEAQLAYLYSLDERFVSQAAARGSYFMAHRLPIGLNKMNASTVSDDGKDRGKLLNLNESSNSNFTPELAYSNLEVLTFNITYFN